MHGYTIVKKLASVHKIFCVIIGEAAVQQNTQYNL